MMIYELRSMEDILIVTIVALDAKSLPLESEVVLGSAPVDEGTEGVKVVVFDDG